MAAGDVTDILTKAHYEYEQSTDDVPALDSDDGVLRLELLHKGIKRWARDNGTRWDELYSITTIGPIVNADAEYDLPADYYMPEAFYLQGDSSPMEVRKPRQVTGVESRFVYVLGNKSDGYKLKLGWTPATGDSEVGKTITAVYLREPVLPTLGTAKPEMSDYHFLISYIVAELFLNDDTELFAKHNKDALNLLANMRERNDQITRGEEQDQDNEEGAPFGE